MKTWILSGANFLSVLSRETNLGWIFYRRYVKKTKDAKKDRSSNNSAGNRSGKDVKNEEKIFRAVEKVDRSNGKVCRVMFVVKRETEAAVDQLVTQY
jgi:hypothetical protein